MPLHQSPAPIARISSIVERLDTSIADATARYLSEFRICPFPIVPEEWANELRELRLGREPDYLLPGVVLTYALTYMARRTLSVRGAYRLIDAPVPPRTVIDIGSGTGATALALDLLDLEGVLLVGLEPSREMRHLAELVNLRKGIRPRYLNGSFADVFVKRSLLNRFDLQVFSAAFPYGFERWDEFGHALSAGDSQGRSLLVIEPEAKASGLDALQASLQECGWSTMQATSKDISSDVTDGSWVLNRLTRVWRRAGSPGREPAAWWSPPDDHYLIARR